MKVLLFFLFISLSYQSNEYEAIITNPLKVIIGSYSLQVGFEPKLLSFYFIPINLQSIYSFMPTLPQECDNNIKITTKEDIDLLCKKANYDVTRVKDAIYYADSRGNISEFMNYVVSVVDHPEWDIEGTAVVNGKDINPELRKIGKEVIKQQKKQENEKKNPKQIYGGELA